MAQAPYKVPSSQIKLCMGQSLNVTTLQHFQVYKIEIQWLDNRIFL